MRKLFFPRIARVSEGIVLGARRMMAFVVQGDKEEDPVRDGA
jgi:hypothetical protein